jgi:membrane-anchored protein YejM (alkaline phosphatase superfamily)
MKRIALALIALFAVALSALAISRKPDRPNIVLISIDTLRADHFTPEHMPLTYQWAKEHGQISTIQAAATWTKPSHVSILSGLTPAEHRVVGLWDAIPPALTMIQSDLQKSGYHTVAFTGGGFLHPQFGFSNGFDVYKDYQGEITDSLCQPLEQANEYISQYDMSAPLFAFVHFYGPHNYAEKHGCKNSEWETALFEPVTSFAADRDALRTWYASDVAACDANLALFLNSIARLNPVILLTSDHGEFLGETWGEEPRYSHGGPPAHILTTVPLVTCGVEAPEKHTDIRASILTIARAESSLTSFSFISEKTTPKNLSHLRALGYIQ